MAITLDGSNGISSPDFEPSSSTVPTNGLFLPTTNTIAWATNSTERLRLDASGNVGIGTSSPSSFSGYTTVSVNNATSGGIYNILVNGTETARLQAYSGIFNVAAKGASTNLTFETNGAERMRLDSSGNFLIGTTSANGRLTVVSGSSTVSPISTFGVSGDTAYQGILVTKFDNNSTTSQNFIQFQINNGAANCGKITANGANTAAFGSTSDRRVKENIIDLPPQLASILALRPVEFDYVESYGGGHQIGFIAQEMQEIYPDVISEEETEEKIMSITGWSKTEARLVKAIQELTQRLEKLENQNG